MSRCFTWFPFSELGEPIYTRTWFELQCVGILLGSVFRMYKMVTKPKLDLCIHLVK